MLNISPQDYRGRDVDVAVADTLYEPPDGIDVDIGSQEDFSPIGDENQEKWSHGSRVFSVLYTLVPDATFHFYRLKTARRLARRTVDTTNPANIVSASDDVVTMDETAESDPDERIIDAITQAREDGVDVLNISGGKLHKLCSTCPFERHVTAADDAGVNVVAAIGNDRQRRGEHVLCPATAERTLSVGGVINRCEAPEPVDQDRRIWTRTTDKSGIDEDRQGPLCSFRGCGPDHDCHNYRTEQYWDENIADYKGNPEILAPVHRPEFDRHNRAFFTTGTSFAAPLLSGAVAILRERFSGASTGDVRRAIVQSARPVGEYGRLDFDAAERELASIVQEVS